MTPQKKQTGSARIRGVELPLHDVRHTEQFILLHFSGQGIAQLAINPVEHADGVLSCITKSGFARQFPVEISMAFSFGNQRRLISPP